MAGWNLQVELLAVSREKQEDGSFKESESATAVWANPMTLGTNTWLAARSNGLHADAQIQMYAIEYEGQENVRIGSTEYNVEQAQSSGEYVTLTLSKRLKNE